MQSEFDRGVCSARRIRKDGIYLEEWRLMG